MFPREAFEAMRDCTGSPGQEAPLGAPLFACHRSPEGEEVACAGWLAAVGVEHLAVRLAISSGRLPESVLAPGPDWPTLHDSYHEMESAKARDW